MNEIKEHQKTVLVTGAGSGIGADLCTGFLAHDYRVIGLDANDSALESLERTFSSGGSFEPVIADVRNESQISELVSRLGTVDILVNNAGLQHVAPVDEFPMQKWRQLIDVMLTGSAALISACLPSMRSQNYGRIVNIGSIHSLVGSAYKSAYVAAKHGLVGLSKVVALETAAYDITINTICPSYVRTPLVAQQVAQQAAVHGMPEAEVEQSIMLAPMPKKCFITSDELLGTAMFLISNAARNITGQSLAVDGGWTVQ